MAVHQELYHEQCRLVNTLCANVRKDFFSQEITSCGKDQKKLYRVARSLLGDNGAAVQAEPDSDQELAERFNTFFINKISAIRASITESRPSSSSDISFDDADFIGQPLTDFTPATVEEERKILTEAPTKLDAIPTQLLKQYLDKLLPLITRIINMSLSWSEFPNTFKHAIVRPLIKRPCLDKEYLRNYRPVSILGFVSKVLERVVSERLEAYVPTVPMMSTSLPTGNFIPRRLHFLKCKQISWTRWTRVMVWCSS